MLLKILFKVTILSTVLFGAVFGANQKLPRHLNRKYKLTHSKSTIPDGTIPEYSGNSWVHHADDSNHCPHSLHGSDGILYGGLKTRNERYWRHRLQALLDGPHIMANKLNSEINVLVKHPQLVPSSRRGRSHRRRCRH